MAKYILSVLKIILVTYNFLSAFILWVFCELIAFDKNCVKLCYVINVTSLHVYGSV